MGRGPRPDDSQPTPAGSGSVAMPRDGDPMNQPKLSLAPVPQEPPGRAPRVRRLGLRAGQKKIQLTAVIGRGRRLRLVFARTRAGIEFWRSFDAEKSPLVRVGVFPGPFTPRAVANLFASGLAGPAIDESDVEDAVAGGVDERWSSLIRLAWSRVAGRPDRRVSPILALGDAMLDEIDRRTGLDHGVEDYLKLGSDIDQQNQAWLVEWRPEIDEEVARRAELEGRAGDEVRCRAHRSFVETCLLTLGRMPYGSENAEAWAGAGLAGRSIGRAQRRKLRLVQSGRVGRFRVRVLFWTAARTSGSGDTSPGPGWYWVTCNPDPGWMVDGDMGPYKSDRDAWEDARCLDQE
jgi:hypothetical protein